MKTGPEGAEFRRRHPATNYRLFKVKDLPCGSGEDEHSSSPQEASIWPRDAARRTTIRLSPVGLEPATRATLSAFMRSLGRPQTAPTSKP
jgi:hypothetical protein